MCPFIRMVAAVRERYIIELLRVQSNVLATEEQFASTVTGEPCLFIYVLMGNLWDGSAEAV